MASDVFSIQGSYDLVDKVSGKLDKISGEVDKHGKKVKGTEKDYDNLSGSLGSKASGIAKSVAMAFSVTAIVGFGKKCVDLASNLAEVQNVVDTTFGESAGVINKFAKDAAVNFGMSELQAKKFTGTMGAMTKSMGLTAEESLSMSTSLTGLSGDMASFYNLDHQEAFDKIRSGISGETEPLKQLGINMSVANLEAYALAQGISKPYNAMSEGEKTQLRYNYLMSVTKDAQGDFAKTSDGYANQLRIAKLNVENLGVSIGSALLPAMNFLMTGFNDAATKVAEFGTKVGEGFGVFKTELAASGEPTYAFGEMFKTIFGVELPQSAYNMVDDIILGFQTLWTTFQSIWDTIAVPIIDIIKGVFTGVGGHADSIFEGIGAAFLFYTNMIKDTWDLVGKPLWDFVIQIIGWVKDMFVEHWGAIQLTFSTVINDLVAIWNNNLKPMFQAIGDFITNVLAPVFHWLMDNVISPVFGAIVQFISGAWTNGIKPVFTGIIDFITGVFSGDWSKAWDGVCSIFSGIFGGLGELIKMPMNAVIGMINKAIDGINSISVEIPDWVKTNKVAQYKDGEFGGSLSLHIAS